MKKVGLLLLSLVLSSCAFSSSNKPGTVTTRVKLATHDSFAMQKSVLKQFEKQYKLTVQRSGDAGALTNKLILTQAVPIADVVYGIDNTFASRAKAAGIFASEPVPIDTSDVCVNIDKIWFAKQGLIAPKNFRDLIKPQYRELLVTPAATTSSTGLAFLLATISAFPTNWEKYWQRLNANGVKVTSGWEDAYNVDFSAGPGKGDRPLVVSYSSSPPFTLKNGKPTTKALLQTCFRQVEYAAVLANAANPTGAAALVKFMQAKAFQQELPGQMYVYPVNPAVKLDAAWAKWAPKASKPWNLPAAEIAQNRNTWIKTWRKILSK